MLLRNLRSIVGALALLVAGVATGTTYELPPDGSDVVGEVSTVFATHDDTLVDIARRHGFGYQEIVRANPDVDVWVPGEGTEIVLPGRFVLPAGPRRGIVLNIAEYRLYYFPDPGAGENAMVMTYPISIGRQDWETPIGLTQVVQKVVDPAWYPPQSVREEHAAEGRPLPSIVPPGPENPLGSRAMRLGLPGYLIHGTNRPAGVGMRVTHGCLRMFPEDIEYLFDHVPLKTRVRIINEPVKLGWDGDRLVIEAHQVLTAGPVETSDEPLPGAGPDDTAVAAAAETANEGTASGGETGAGAEPVVFAAAGKDPLTSATEQFVAVTADRPGELDWVLVEEAVARADGLPVIVGGGTKNAATSAAFD